MASFKFGDLFAGGGGYSVGMKAAGLSESFALEFDEWACDTLRENLSCMVMHEDITNVTDAEILSLPDIDLLVGGPPCQGFSVAGPSQYGIEDPRNNLFMHFLRFVELKKPLICIIENVPQIMTKKIGHGKTAFDVIKSKFEELGYIVQAKVLNSADYGVPQSRKRAFIAAYFKEIKFSFPDSTHFPDNGGMPLFENTSNKHVTVWEAISDLPSIGASEGVNETIPYETRPDNSYQEVMRADSGGVSNHIAMKHTKRLIERFSAIGTGKSLKDVGLSVGQKKKYTGEINAKPYKSNNQRLTPDKVCLAIPASFQSNFLHPFKHRNLTAREAARLMSFPDKHIFMGKRTCMSWEKNLSQYNQIGNAVCPLVAKALGGACIKALEGLDVSGVKKPSISQRITVPVTAKSCRKDFNTSLCLDDISFLKPSARKILKTEVADEYFNYKGLKIPVVYFPLTLIIASEAECMLCDESKPPFALHDHKIPFLISKDGFKSISAKGYDNGLDYHLRKFGEFPSQVAHYVGEVLRDLGFATIKNDLVNDRTGRAVRGLEVVTVPEYINEDRFKLKDLLRNHIKRD